MKLAVYAIAKNEEKHVTRWLDAIVNSVDKIIVVDTGSTDKTMELFKHYQRFLGSLIEIHTLELDNFRFDDARNFALSKVPDDMDICVSLDLDEVPSTDFFKTLKECWTPTTTRAWVKWDTGNVWWNNNRVHSRNGYKWKYPCHELIVPSIEEHIIRCDVTVNHIPDDSKPRTSYLKMLRQGFKEMPDDSRMFTYFMRELSYYKMWDEIVGLSHRVESFLGYWIVEMAQTYRIIGDANYVLGNLDKAEKSYIQATEVAPRELESWLSLAFFYYRTNQWAKCAGAADKVNYLQPGDHYIAKDSSVWSMYDLLSLSYWNMGIYSESLRYAKLAYKANDKDERLASNLRFIEEETEKRYGL